MPRYFFSVYDGYASIDRTGTELSGLEEARRFALHAAGRVLDGEAESVTAGADWRLEVCDERGDVLFTLNFTLRGAPGALAVPAANQIGVHRAAPQTTVSWK